MKTTPVLLACVLLLATASCTSPSDSYQERPDQVVVVPETLPDLDATAGALVWKSSSDDSLGFARKVAVTVQLPTTTSMRVSYLLTNTSTVAKYNPSLDKLLSVQGSSRQVGQQRPRPSAASVDFVRREWPKKNVLPTSWTAIQGRSLRAVLPYTAPEVGASLFFKEELEGLLTQAGTHLRYRSPVAVAGRTLNVWVADDCWSEDGTNPGFTNPDPNAGTKDADPTRPWNKPAHLVTQAMVDALAARFLTDGVNDVYGWVTGIYGKEWYDEGDARLEGLIDGHGEVHIFVKNLNPIVDPAGVLLGYFYGGNNFEQQVYSDSNEKVLFTLDAASLANPDDDGKPSTTDDQTQWSIDDAWPSAAVSTLAHEFQHMIHLYQKQVTHELEAETATWIDEMASLVTEDLVADKLKISGPRGVPDGYGTGEAKNQDGWFPLFNVSHDQTALTAWDNEDPLQNYASAYAFGAWLVRNYGGPALLGHLVRNDLVDARAVVAAVNATNEGKPDFVNQTYQSLVRDWGLACFLESSTIAPYQYRTEDVNGNFAWNLGALSYAVGSIDLGNYLFSVPTYSLEGPYIYPHTWGPPTSADRVAAGSTFFYDAGLKTGTFRASLVLPAQVQLTVVVTPP